MLSRPSLSQRFLALLLAAGLAFTFGGCERLKSTESLYRDAEVRYQKGELNAAIIQLKAALQKEPNHGPSRLLSAKAYNDLRDFVSAEKEARKAQELGQNAEQVNLQLARSLFGQGQYAKALELVKVTPELSGEALARVLVLRGDAQLGLREPAQAKASYEAALIAAPSYVDAYIGKARLAAANNDADEAMRQIEAALQKAPNSPEGLIIKGDLLVTQNKIEAAIAAYREVSKATPNSAAPYFRLANLYLVQGKPDEVVKAVQLGQKADPGSLEGPFILARKDFQLKDYKSARTHIQAVLRAAPDHMPSILLSGAIASALGESELAEKNLNRVISAIPENSYARSLLAADYLKKGQADLALEVLAPVLESDQADERALSIAGQAYLTKGDVARATSMFEKAQIANPKNAATKTRLGAARLAGGDIKQAVADLEAASAMDTQEINADLVLILNYLKQKEYDKALSAIAVLEKKQPTSPMPMNLRGGVNLAQGDIKAARSHFEQALSIRGDFLPAVQNLVQLDLHEKNIPAARKRYENLLAKDKGNLGAMMGLAQLAALDKNDKAYGEWLGKAVAAKPEALEPRILLVEFHLKQKQSQEALRLATEAHSAKPEDSRTLDLLARVQFAVGEKESSLQSYKKLVQQEPKSAPAFFRLGLAEIALNQLEGAASSMRKALSLQPAYYEAAAGLVGLNVKQGRNDEALKVTKAFQQQNPKLAAGYLLEGDLLVQQRKFDAAIPLMLKAQSLQPSGQVAIRVHQLQFAANRPDEADRGLEGWLKNHSGDLLARLHLAESYQVRKKNKAAIAQYEIVQKTAPEQVVALNNLALLYQAEKDARALPTAEQAYKLKPDIGAVADTLGWMLVEQGQTARGVEILRKALAADKDNGDIAYHYAAALAKSGDKAGAKKQLEATLSSGKTFSLQEQAKALLKQL